MSIVTYGPINVFTFRGVSVEQYEPDFNDLAWQTFTLLTPGLDVEHPGPDEAIAQFLVALLGSPRLYPFGTVYANPCAVVRSRYASDEFLRTARRFQAQWFHQFNDSLSSGRRVREQMSLVAPVTRQLVYTGVLVIDNRHIFPDRWPGKPPLSPGTRFGCLVVQETLARGMVRCRCECDNVVIKHRKHLVSGGTKSCGCRKTQREARLKERRRDRGWKHTGTIDSE